MSFFVKDLSGIWSASEGNNLSLVKPLLGVRLYQLVNCGIGGQVVSEKASAFNHSPITIKRQSHLHHGALEPVLVREPPRAKGRVRIHNPLTR